MRLDYYKDYVIGLIKATVLKFNIDNKNTQISVITFSNTAMVEFYLNNYTTQAGVLNAVEKISYSGHDTNLASALNLAKNSVFIKETGARMNDPSVSKICIVLLNYKTSNQANALKEAESLRQIGVRFYAVGTGTILDTYELAAIANYPVSKSMKTVSTARDLHTLSEPLKRFACSGQFQKLLKALVVVIVENKFLIH